jgi:hypothetical protein
MDRSISGALSIQRTTFITNQHMIEKRSYQRNLHPIRSQDPATVVIGAPALRAVRADATIKHAVPMVASGVITPILATA